MEVVCREMVRDSSPGSELLMYTKRRKRRISGIGGLVANICEESWRVG